MNKYGNSSSNWEQYLLMNFNLSTIPQITNIDSAKLYIYYYDFDKNDPSGRNLSIHKITSSWEEEDVTWNSRPTYSSDFSANSTIPSDFGWMEWNVTSDIQDFVSGYETNYGWQITDEYNWSEYDIPISKFKSKETQTSYIPYLEISYKTPLVAYADGPTTWLIDEPVQFEGSYMGMSTPPYEFRWDFGDGETSTYQNSSHTYNNVGIYRINFTVTDANDEKAKDIAYIIIVMDIQEENDTENETASSSKNSIGIVDEMPWLYIIIPTMAIAFISIYIIKYKIKVKTYFYKLHKADDKIKEFNQFVINVKNRQKYM